jgi:hypothetical protein
MINGKPLPPVKDVTPPDTQRLDELIALWDANCPPFYKGLLEAGTATSRFVYDKSTMAYSVKGGRKLTRAEVKQVYADTMAKIGVR